MHALQGVTRQFELLTCTVMGQSLTMYMLQHAPHDLSCINYTYVMQARYRRCRLAVHTKTKQ